MNRYTFVLSSDSLALHLRKCRLKCNTVTHGPLVDHFEIRRRVLRVKKMTKFKKNTSLSLSLSLSLSICRCTLIFPKGCAYTSISLSFSIHICKNGLDQDQTRMEFRKECFVILNIWAGDRKHTKHRYCRISDFVVQKPMRTRSISKYHFQHRYMIFFEITRDSYASAIVSLSLSLSLSTICFQSLQKVCIQKISDVLPDQIRGKQAYQKLIM